MSRVTQLTAADADAMLLGAEFFGASIAGHHLEHFRSWLREVLLRRGPVPVVPPAELPAETQCAAIGVAGSMIAVVELPPSGDEPQGVAAALENQLDRKLGAVMAMNAATINALLPVIAAAELDLPIVDCDGMGRILPLISQTSYTVAGLPLTPMTATSAVRDQMSVVAEAQRAELLVRAMLNTAGGWLLCGLYPTTARQLVTGAIEGSISRVVRVGRVLAAARDRDHILRGLGSEVGATWLGGGQVVEVGPSGKRGAEPNQPANPTTVVVRERGSSGRVIRIEAQNELLLAVVDGVLVTAVPDLICLLDRNGLRIQGLERTNVGDEVDVLMVPAAPVWHTPAGLALAGPQAFGLPVRHPKEPVE
ncbi:hypothetical protein EV191_102344 [Tamaricihabitans halophyticus]|uniref:DUF917 family protein n=1 Tax=Tamaricihabitans halophyticus TaxID=1262583 RepID=A0A4R2QY45_9PSEU|nr:DUF917 domain-containing protein [Tamaricihabitans halophyticus]TCP55132.1 hypothetical protein EV191_102344 [Tamaricihabitans halophyticus]